MKTLDEILDFIRGQRKEEIKMERKILNLARRYGLKCQNCDLYKIIEGTNPPVFYCTGNDRGESWPECFCPNEEWEKKHEK